MLGIYVRAGAMFGLVLNALRARRAQTVALFALTVLAAMGASAAPWFLGWARDAVSRADVAAAPALQRLVIAAGSARYQAGEASPADLLRQRVSQEFDIPGAAVVVGARLYVNMAPAGATNGPAAGLYLNFRDDICAQLRLIDGACPTRPGDVIIGRSTAESLGLAVGDQVRFEGFRYPQPVTLRISGTYEVLNQLSPYWAGADLLPGPVGAVGTVIDEAAYVSEQTMLATAPNGLDLDFHLYLPEQAYRGRGVNLTDTLGRATDRLRPANLTVNTKVPDLVAQIDADQRLLELGVTVAATQMVLLCWFVLFLAIRHTSEERRPDIGLLKLRGAAPWRIWSLTALQSAAPMLAGAVAGWGLGFLGATALAGDVSQVAHTSDTDVAATVVLSIVAAAAACLGSLLSAVLAEWRALRSSVVTLLRRVPGRRRTWRAEVGDLVIVVVAGIGVYQGYAETAASGQPSLLALLAPALVGLAVALVVARALPLLAGRAGAAALRSGRPGAGLTALHLARRPGTHRVFAVLAVCVAVFTTATFFWHTASVAWDERAGQELGAQRVLTVRAANSTTLLAAVRAIDPAGDFAMAVARTDGSRVETRVIAVDSTRLAAVALPPKGFGGGDQHGGSGGSDWDSLATLLRPPAPSAPSITDGPITVDLKGPAELRADRPLGLRLHIITATGTLTTVDFGPVGVDRRTYQASVTGCPAARCRLLALEAVTQLADASPAQVTLDLYGIAQPGGAVVAAPMLSDITRWTGQVGAAGVGNVLTAGDGHLTIAPYTAVLRPGQRRDLRVFVVDAPIPLPLVLAGSRPVAQRPGDGRFTIMGTERVSYRVVASTTVLPRVGVYGALVDLEYAQRTVTRAAEAAVLEVWLNAAAPDDTVARLQGQGIQVLTQESVDDVANRLARQGPGAALRFQLFAAGIVLLLAAGTVVVTATVERRSRVEELAALRTQGLSERSMWVAGHGGTGVLVGAAILTGLIAALIAQAVVATSMPVFADGWSLLPLRQGPQPLPLMVSVVAAVLVVGTAAIASSARVVASVRGRPRRGREVGGPESAGATGEAS